MKEVTFFYIDGCPYCTQARKAIRELTEENPSYASVSFREIEEHANPEIADQYDYWATPSMFIDHDKYYEAHIGEKYEECKAHVKEVLDAALAS
ncbi:MAG: thioredoxin family protein [Lachnospiraceae bacterium]|nr:thioredoxin family protein [Lachnospiraceae bacterium]